MQFEIEYLVLYLLAAIGLYTTVIFSYECGKSPLAILWSVFFPNDEPLNKRYGPWAVITGSSDGIGKQYAFNLASKGMNVFLISRTESKLQDIAEQIRSQYSVKVQWLAIDFSQSPKIYETIRKSLTGLEIGILVNNVGVAEENPLAFDEISIENVQQSVSINIMAALQMTHMLLPGMKQRRRGLIINMSSSAGNMPMPYHNLYGASKAYLNSFTLALDQELRGSGVECQLVNPMFVRTKINKVIHSDKTWSVILTDVEKYTEHAVATIGRTNCTTGYWVHGLQTTLCRLLPKSVLVAHWNYSAKIIRAKLFRN
ncbi:hydroxysteroid dehydrogenase-like protein 1 [Wyeomyia smithii]|uniref:hydroxysteroid dehydrogenase-like protein 1 n=1 Tax=Wyeomyia smithii TaxID=174621 RepID=UPI002467B27F|nr:hydroxysteroid dehydrogenase-like protein 1 [Wyeomyia smithii]